MEKKANMLTQQLLSKENEMTELHENNSQKTQEILEQKEKILVRKPTRLYADFYFDPVTCIYVKIIFLETRAKGY